MRILIVGLGLIAQRHIRNLHDIDQCIEIAVLRQRPKHEDLAALNLPVAHYFYQVGSTVEDGPALDWAPDAAIVANPATWHIQTAMSLAKAGAHLFVEKPIAAEPWGVDDLIGECRRRNLTLMVGYDLRFYRPLQAVKEAIDAGRIGRVISMRAEVGSYLPDWRPGRDHRQSVSAHVGLGGGVVLELSHEIDYARWLLGEVVAVSARLGRQGRHLEVNVEDTADIVILHASGAQSNLHLDMVDRMPVRRCRVVGTEGALASDIQTGRVDCFHLRPGGPEQLRAGELLWDILHEGLTVMPDPFVEEMRHFLACCRGEAVPPVDGGEGRRVLSIVLAAKRSAEEKREMDV